MEEVETRNDQNSQAGRNGGHTGLRGEGESGVGVAGRDATRVLDIDEVVGAEKSAGLVGQASADGDRSVMTAGEVSGVIDGQRSSVDHLSNDEFAGRADCDSGFEVFVRDSTHSDKRGRSALSATRNVNILNGAGIAIRANCGGTDTASNTGQSSVESTRTTRDGRSGTEGEGVADGLVEPISTSTNDNMVIGERLIRTPRAGTGLGRLSKRKCSAGLARDLELVVGDAYSTIARFHRYGKKKGWHQYLQL